MTVPESPSSSREPVESAGTSSPSIRVCVALPPAPCAIVMRSSRNFAPLRARGLDDAEDPLLAIGDDRRSASKLDVGDVTHTTSRSRANRP